MTRDNKSAAAVRLGEYIRQLRTERGLSIRGLAARIKVDATWLSRLERGIYDSPDPRSLWKVARALDVEVADLYLTAGYADVRALPGLVPYLRAKYNAPEEAIQQLQAHFELIAEKYHLTEDHTP